MTPNNLLNSVGKQQLWCTAGDKMKCDSQKKHTSYKFGELSLIPMRMYSECKSMQGYME